MAKLEGIPFMLTYEDDILKNITDEEKKAIWRAWEKAGRPGVRVLGPKANVLQFRSTRDLMRFCNYLPESWELVSPGAFGAGEITRQATHTRIWTTGSLISFRTAEGIVLVPKMGVLTK